MSDVTNLGKTAKAYALDLVERIVSTFAVATGGVLVTANVGNVGHVSFWQGVGAGGVAAVLSLVKGTFAKLRGDNNSASLVKGV